MSQALNLETHLKKLRLPSMLKHYHKLAADAAHECGQKKRQHMLPVT